jgi:hypothetical protein
LPVDSYGDDLFHVAALGHGTQVTAKIIGSHLGVVKDATAVILDRKGRAKSFTTGDGQVRGETVINEKHLEVLLNAADDIVTKGRSGKSVVLFAYGTERRQVADPYPEMLRKFFVSQARALML